MWRRINVSLSEEAVRLLDRMAPKGDRMAMRRTVVAFPKRGDVYSVRFDPTEGAEIAKTRPALIIQNDVGNRFSDLTIAAPITSEV